MVPVTGPDLESLGRSWHTCPIEGIYQLKFTRLHILHGAYYMYLKNREQPGGTEKG